MHPALLHTLRLCQFQRAPVLVMHLCRPERIDRSRTRPMPGLVVRPRRVSRNVAIARCGTSSATEHQRNDTTWQSFHIPAHKNESGNARFLRSLDGNRWRPQRESFEDSRARQAHKAFRFAHYGDQSKDTGFDAVIPVVRMLPEVHHAWHRVQPSFRKVERMRSLSVRVLRLRPLDLTGRRRPRSP